jgi:hypothetical protein
MEFVSIGPYCTTADILKEHSLRLNAYPFDYIFSSLKMVTHCIKDNFDIFLDKQYYRNGTNECSTKHSFYCKFLDTEILQKHHIKHKYHNNYKVSCGNLFNHHNLITDKNNYESFKRRCERLLNLIRNKKSVFVYYDCYTTNYDDIINFCNEFSDNKNIYVLGIFENNSDKISFEGLNYKIYQNYDRKYVFDEIQLVYNNQMNKGVTNSIC